jgi:tetratricopeptide (TPR) repeat protein
MLQLHYRLPHLLLRLRCYDAAVNACARALRSRPDDPDLHFLMACALQKGSRHEEAVDSFCEAVRLGATAHADLHFNHAISLSALGRIEEAADAYQTAAHLNPSDAEAWGSLGAAFADLGRWKDAAPCQERAMRLAPSLPQGINLAETLYELNRLDEAEEVLRRCLVIDPKSAEAKETLAMVLAGQDRYDEALTVAREVCAVPPVALSSRVALAGVLMEAGRLEEALREATAVAETAPSDPRSQILLGGIHVKMNNGAAALAAFDRVKRELDASEHPPRSTRLWSAVGRGSALSVLERHDEAMSAFDDALRIDPSFFERWPEVAAHYERSRSIHVKTSVNG